MLSMTEGEPFARSVREGLRRTAPFLLTHARKPEGVEGIRAGIMVRVAMRWSDCSRNVSPLWNKGTVDQRQIPHRYPVEHN